MDPSEIPLRCRVVRKTPKQLNTTSTLFKLPNKELGFNATPALTLGRRPAQRLRLSGLIGRQPVSDSRYREAGQSDVE